MSQLTFLSTVDAAKLAAKKEFGHHCLKTGLHYKDLNAHGLILEGCHLLQISTFKKLECCVQNIFPLNSRDHRDRRVDCLDYITYKDSAGWAITRNRTPRERLQWLLTHPTGEYRQRVRERLWALMEGIIAEIDDHQVKNIASECFPILEAMG